MRLDELKIGDKFKTYFQMTEREHNMCVYVGVKTVPQSEISESKKVHCFIDYNNNHSMYASASHEVEKVDHFEVINKMKWDIEFACSPYVFIFNLTKYNLNYLGSVTTVYIAHKSPEQMHKYIAENSGAINVSFDEIPQEYHSKIIF